jgi:hypothetical protein
METRFIGKETHRENANRETGCSWTPGRRSMAILASHRHRTVAQELSSRPLDSLENTIGQEATFGHFVEMLPGFTLASWCCGHAEYRS